MFHEQKVPSKVELFKLDKLPKKELDIKCRDSQIQKTAIEERKAENEVSQSQWETPQDQANSPKDQNELPQDQASEQSESKRMEDKNIQDGIQKGEWVNTESAQTQEDADDALEVGKFELSSDQEQRQLKLIDIWKQFKFMKIKWYGNHPHKTNFFNQIGIISILCYGNIVGYESEYISGLKNINPSEAILIDMLLNKRVSEMRESPEDQPYHINNIPAKEVILKSSTIAIFEDKIAALNTSKNQAVDKEDYSEADKLK